MLRLGHGLGRAGRRNPGISLEEAFLGASGRCSCLTEKRYWGEVTWVLYVS